MTTTPRAERRPDTEPDGAPAAPHTRALAGDFDVREWTRQACEASGVSFAVTDPVALDRLRALVAHPG
ncbi:hypothetical protein MZK47_15370 [Microbacterium aerolatum]|uniref:hypothetical protein n=1 Tax=Microbacterium aerolatum TaxID=153731 RepID=UPI0020012AB3|nr:hypothetical protein [Microbacterium aerolatum]MCK3771049.1 hypothetical protein [Microbacterium aerolatum]